MTEPMLTRRTRASKRIENGTGEPTYPATATDLMLNAIEQRFDQPSFDTYTRRESHLVKAHNSQDNSTELQFMEICYGGDVDIEMLTAQMKNVEIAAEGL